VRKTVTVFFCDVSGSTALGERIDPESLRAVMARYFETARTILERHGGSVEKFIGDAVMAVFGVPTAHEDEALELTDETERIAAPDDFEPHARKRLVRGRALARRGDVDAADELLREAAEIIEPTDFAILHLELAFARAEVERLAGRPAGERQALERALAVAEAKGDIVAAEPAARAARGYSGVARSLASAPGRPAPAAGRAPASRCGRPTRSRRGALS
jgi:class 3 adenylate cyclase